MQQKLPRRIGRLVVGAVVGFVTGAIIAVNLVITAGIDRGYESSLADVFKENTVVGVLTVAALVSGPIVGVIVANRRPRDRDGT